MMHWATGMGGWGMLIMSISGLLFWSLIIVGVVLLVRRDNRPAPASVTAPTPQQILAIRLARGEIGEEEYHSRLYTLGGDPPYWFSDQYRS